MMFYVIEISKVSGKDSKAIYGFEDKTTAIGTFHSKLGAAMKSATYDSELIMVIDADGKVLKREHYEKPVEPDVEPDHNESAAE